MQPLAKEKLEAIRDSILYYCSFNGKEVVIENPEACDIDLRFLLEDDNDEFL